MSTAAEAEAERRWPVVVNPYERRIWLAGAEWALEQYRELLEAAEAYRKAWMENMGGPTTGGRRSKAIERLLAAAAALPKQEGGEPP